MTGRWFNGAAVEWVLYEAPPDIPPHLVATYLAVASFTGYDGRGAYPSAETIALLTRKTRRRTRVDLDELAKRGLLEEGDRRTVAHLRADRRPDVYDLPEAGREYVGRHRKRGVADVPSHEGSQTSPRTDSRGVADGLAGGRTRPSGGSHTTPEELLKSSGKGVPPAPGGGGADDTPETQNPARVTLSAEAARCADARCRGSRFQIDPESGLHDECKGFARFRAVKIR